MGRPANFAAATLACVAVLLAWSRPIAVRFELVPTLLAGDTAATTVYVTKTGKKYHRDTTKGSRLIRHC